MPFVLPGVAVAISADVIMISSLPVSVLTFVFVDLLLMSPAGAAALLCGCDATGWFEFAAASGDCDGDGVDDDDDSDCGCGVSPVDLFLVFRERSTFSFSAPWALSRPGRSTLDVGFVDAVEVDSGREVWEAEDDAAMSSETTCLLDDVSVGGGSDEGGPAMGPGETLSSGPLPAGCRSVTPSAARFLPFLNILFTAFIVVILKLGHRGRCVRLCVCVRVCVCRTNVSLC